MKAIAQSFQSIIKQILLISGCLMMLAACGEAAPKMDLMKISKVFYDTGWTPDKQKDMQQRLQGAKSEAEAKQVLDEMMKAIEPTPAKLDALDLQTPEAKSARDKLSAGLRGVVENTRAFMNLSMPNDAEKAIELQGKLIESQKTLQEGFQELQKFAAAQGLDLEKLQKEAK